MIKKILFFSSIFFSFLVTSDNVLAQENVIEVFSTTDSSTRIIEHNHNNLNQVPNWIDLNFDDSNWPAPKQVWEPSWWVNSNWRPDGNSSAPQGTWYFMKWERSNDPKVIQYTSEPWRPSQTKNFFRKKFNIPQDKEIDNATLYINSDNLSKYWLNGARVVGTDNSFNNNGNCNQITDGSVEAFIRSYDVTQHLNNGENILSGNLLNWRVCGETHPMGAQFFLRIEVSDPPPQVADCTSLQAYDRSGNRVAHSDLTAGESYNFRMGVDPKNATSTDRVGVVFLDSPVSQVTTNQTSACNNVISEFSPGLSSPLTSPSTVNIPFTAPDSTGNYTVYGRVWNDGITECRSACVDGPPRYPCETGVSACKFEVTVNQRQSNVSCEEINVFRSNGTPVSGNVINVDPGEQLQLSARVNNFVQPGEESLYRWGASNGNVNVSTDRNCTGSRCVLDSNLSYTTDLVSYTAPSSGDDTVNFLVNNDSSISCRQRFEVTSTTTQQGSVTMNFQPDTYQFDVDNGTSGNLLVESTNIDIPSYNINLQCPPGLTCSFDNNTQRTQVNLTAGVSQNLNVDLFSTQEDTFTIRAEGSSNGNYPSSAEARAFVSSVNTYNLGFDLYESTDIVEEGEDYCTDSSINLDSYNDNLNLSISDENGNPLSGLGIPSNTGSTAELPGGETYIINITPPDLFDTQNSEIKCVEYENDVQSGGSISINDFSSDSVLEVVIGPKTPGPWFKAFGGDIYSSSGVTSNIPEGVSDDDYYILDSFDGVEDGVLEAGGSIDPSHGKNSESEIYIESSNSNPGYLSSLLENIKSFEKEESYSDFDDIESNSTETLIYVVDGDVDITEDKDFGDERPPIVLVKGNINIESSVNQLDMYLMTVGISKKIIIEGDENDDPLDKLIVNGGLISYNEIDFAGTGRSLVDNRTEPAEEFYFRPEIYFISDEGNARYFMEKRVYADVID